MLVYMDHTCDRVGTAVGSKSSQLLGSTGTQTRPRKRNNNQLSAIGCIVWQKNPAVLRIVQFTHK
jgi:hypothetical protein